MTYDADRHERDTARIAEKQTRLYKWIAGFTVAAIVCFGYAALSIFHFALPATITLILFGVFSFCAIKSVVLRDEIAAARRQMNRELDSIQ